MDSARWERIQAVFHEAFDLPDERRRAFVESACQDDAELAADVMALLEGDASGHSLLDDDLANVAHDVLDGSVPLLHSIGAYRIDRVIGRGGMGVVYLAEREDLRSRAAIKVLRDASLSPARRERFKREQQVLAQLAHPSIARLYDADVLPDGTPFFVMEYVRGTSLTAYCDARECSIPERLRLFRAVCEAVQYAHRQAVIHRDLKPSNILVTEDGLEGEPSIKLLDFGIAKQLDSLDVPVHQTLTGLRPMTPAYAAPELIRGEPVGVYTDVYALGVILYELLTHTHPFAASGLTPGQIEAEILRHDPERPSAAGRRTIDRPGRPSLASVIGRLASPTEKSASPSERSASPSERSASSTERSARPSERSAGPSGRSGPPIPGHAWKDLDALCLTAMHGDSRRRYPTVEALIRDLDRFLKGEPLEARPDTARYRMGKFIRRRGRELAVAALGVAAVIALVAFYTLQLATARDAAFAEATRTQRIERFMMSLFESDGIGADSLRVVTLLDRGVRDVRLLDGEPEVQVELYQTLGTLYRELGDFDRADSLLVTALERRRALFGPDHSEVARTMVALGLLRIEQAELEEAERLIREGLIMNQRSLLPEHPAVAEAVTALGTALTARGVYDQAIDVLEDAVRLHAAREPNGVELSEALYELANAHFYAGNYTISDSLNRLVMALDRRLFGPRHPSVANALVNLGASRFQLGEYEAAELLYRQALEIKLGYFGPDHHETASAMIILGQSLTYQERYEEALDLLRPALAVRERVYGPDHPRVANTLNELGTVALMQGDFAAAESYYRRMTDVYRRAYDDDHYLIGLGHSNLSSVYRETGRYELAEEAIREAIDRFIATLGAGHLHTAISRIKLGRVLVLLHRYDEAETPLLAGHDLLAAHANPSVSWLQAARSDLVVVYEALQRPEEAARFRAEPAAAE